MTDEVKDGGAAFPQMHPNAWGNAQGGMSLRDWVAGQNMAAAMASASGLGEVSQNVRTEALMQVARICYEAADALLSARKAPQ